MMKKIDKNTGGRILLTAVYWESFCLLGKEEGTWAVVTIDGTEYGSYALIRNRRLIWERAIIWRSEVERFVMTEADCPDQICVQTGSISKEHEMIVCMAHKVIVEIRKE